MSAYFECSHCRRITPILAVPPRCPACGGGKGMVRSAASPDLPRAGQRQAHEGESGGSR